MSGRDPKGRVDKEDPPRTPAWRRPKGGTGKTHGSAVDLDAFETRAKHGSNRHGHDRSEVLGATGAIDPTPSTARPSPDPKEEQSTTHSSERDRTSLRRHPSTRSGARLGGSGPTSERRPSRGPTVAALLMVIVSLVGMVWASNLMLSPSGSGFLFQDPVAVNGTITLRGLPLEAAMVSVESSGARTFTSRDGDYRLAAVPLGAQRLIVTHPSARTAVISTFVVGAATQPPADVNLQPASSPPLDLRKGNGTLLLSIIDDGGMPLPGVIVQAVLAQGNRSVLSDGSGLALLDNLSAGRLQLEVQHPGHAPLTLWLTLLIGDNPLRVSLSGGTLPQVHDLDGGTSTVQLQLRDHSGVGLVGAMLLVDNDRSHPATSDSFGQVRLGSLSPGEHRIVVRFGRIDAVAIDLTVREQLPPLEVTTRAAAPTTTSKVGEAYNILAVCGSVYLLVSALLLVAGYAAFRRTRLWLVVGICIIGLLANIVTIAYAAVPLGLATTMVVFHWREFE